MPKFEQFPSEEVKEKWQGKPGEQKVKVGKLTNKGVEFTPPPKKEDVMVGKFTEEGIEVTGRLSVPKKEESEEEKRLRIERDRQELERRLSVIAESARRLIDAGWGVEKTIQEAIREEADLEDEL